MPQHLILAGEFWCGCGGETERGSFFLPGHDKVAEAVILLIEYGEVLEFLARRGYAPGGKNPRKDLESFRNRGKVNVLK